jgi:hypothetical protein
VFQPIMMVHFKPFATKQQAEGILVYLYLYICVSGGCFGAGDGIGRDNVGGRGSVLTN